MGNAFAIDRNEEDEVSHVRAVPTDAQWAARRHQVHAEQIASFGGWIARYRAYLAAAVAGDVAECERLVVRERALRGKR